MLEIINVMNFTIIGQIDLLQGIGPMELLLAFVLIRCPRCCNRLGCHDLCEAETQTVELIWKHQLRAFSIRYKTQGGCVREIGR